MIYQLVGKSGKMIKKAKLCIVYLLVSLYCATVFIPAHNVFVEDVHSTQTKESKPGDYLKGGVDNP
jgi:galactitol-specific phosphotransferase system IIC component